MLIEMPCHRFVSSVTLRMPAPLQQGRSASWPGTGQHAANRRPVGLLACCRRPDGAPLVRDALVATSSAPLRDVPSTPTGQAAVRNVEPKCAHLPNYRNHVNWALLRRWSLFQMR